MKKSKHLIPLCILLLLWGSLSLFCWLKPENLVSVSERRKLASLPALRLDSVLSGRFFSDFETYSLDQFPLRDHFRTLKSISEQSLFRKCDNNNIYLADGHAARLEYPLNESAVQNAAQKLNALYETYLLKNAGNIYLSIIPDKNYFLAAQNGYPAMDYNRLFNRMRDEMPYAKYIDITSALEADDYYKTDSHWKQEKLTDVAQIFANAMGVHLSGNYKKTVVEKPFYGVYYGQSALPLTPDTLCYLTSRVLDSCTVYNVETQKNTGLYTLEKLESRDMYELYLSGASPILSIESPHASTPKELIVFRDSFASSLVPLLSEGYTKITLIDTRYIQPSTLGKYVDFEGNDVLFLYSTTLLNNSQTLR